MTADSQDILKQIVQFCSKQDAVEVLWLYGSRAKGTSEADSDYDLAVALCGDMIGDYVWLDDLAYQLRQLTGEQISVVDINHIPIPLAINVIDQGQVLFCPNNLRLHREMQRIWSMWEHYKYQFEREQGLGYKG